jgi:hypothetical protein
MKRVKSQQQGDVQAGFFDGNFLYAVRRARAIQIKQVADCSRPDGIFRDRRDQGAGHGMIGRGHRQLAEFFGQRHLGDQAVNMFHEFPALQCKPMLCFFMPFRSPQC